MERDLMPSPVGLRIVSRIESITWILRLVW
jgi:hypothetical protein